VRAEHAGHQVDPAVHQLCVVASVARAFLPKRLQRHLADDGLLDRHDHEAQPLGPPGRDGEHALPGADALEQAARAGRRAALHVDTEQRHRARLDEAQGRVTVVEQHDLVADQAPGVGGDTIPRRAVDHDASSNAEPSSLRSRPA
jgi:hypothetical protein